MEDLETIIGHIDGINIDDDTPPATLSETLRVLCDQQNKILSIIEHGGKRGGNLYPASELERTLVRVSRMIKDIADRKANNPEFNLEGLSPFTRRRMLGPPEIPPDEIIFDHVKDYIGGGAYGKVYKGFCRGKSVAVKVPVRQYLSEAELQSFRNEVNIMSQSFHPNVVLYLGASTQPNQIMIVTELMKTDLERLIHHNPDAKNITLYQRMKLAKDAALGMNWLHGICKIIHRDLKPANLLVDHNFNVKVTDFGFAENLKADRYLFDKKGPKGTALYMAPEVMRQEAFNEKADVYSFGLILWELLTGEEPFPQYEDLDPFYQAICFDDERPPIPADTSPLLSQLMQNCWDPDPNVRPTFDSLIRCLDEILVECCIQEPSARVFWKKYFLTPRQTLQEEVAWKDFALALSVSVHAQFTQEQLTLLSALVTEQKLGSPGTLIVTMERMQLLTAWFGPFFQDAALVQEMAQIQSKQWFHGMIPIDVAERRLRGKPNGSFLVRLSLSDPGPSPFTISRLRGGVLSHKRISRPSLQKKTLTVPVENATLEFETLVALIDHLKSIGNIGMDCPRSAEMSNPYTND